MSEHLRLTVGNLSLELCPELGGAVTGFRVGLPAGQFELMRPLSVPSGANPHALYSSMFPMVPFANNIRDNVFQFDGIRYFISPNIPGVRLNYHGSGWQLPWSVAFHSPSRVELVLEDANVDDAFQYTARQSFELTHDALAVELVVGNRSERTMPFSCGLHPWFPRHSGAMVRFAAGPYWVEDDAGHTVALAAPDSDANFGEWNTPPATYQNKCFTGWSGVAEVFWPAAGITLHITGDPLLGHMMFHVPPNGDPIFCLEPQTNAPCAFDGLERGVVSKGVHVLAPGEELSVAIRFELRTDRKHERI